KDAEETLNQDWQGALVPCLRRIRLRVSTRVLPLSPAIAADALGNAMSSPDQGQIVKSLRQPMNLFFKAETLQAEQEGCILHGPNAAEVITKRVIGWIIRGDRSDSPSAENVGLEQSSDE